MEEASQAASMITEASTAETSVEAASTAEAEVTAKHRLGAPPSRTGSPGSVDFAPWGGEAKVG